MASCPQQTRQVSIPIITRTVANVRFMVHLLLERVNT